VLADLANNGLSRTVGIVDSDKVTTTTV
jgi:hypothetical protein